MKLYLDEARAERDVVLHSVEFVKGVGEVDDRDFNLIDYLVKYYGVKTSAPSKPAAKAVKAEVVEK